MGRLEKGERETHETNCKAYQEEIQEAIERLARTKGDYQKNYRMNNIRAKQAEMARYVQWFKVKGKVAKVPELPEDLEALGKELRKKSAQLAAEEKRRRAEAKAELERQSTEAIARWRAGESVSVPYALDTMLRIEGDEVVTSRGARVPVDHARRALRYVRLVMHKREEYKRNGHTEHIGHYAIDRITPDGTLYAGCHVITWEEIQRIAPQLEDSQA